MPIKRHRNYYQYGETGKKYYYTSGDKQSRSHAKRKAVKQMRAIKARKK